jgi:hypothetical protein
VTLCDCERGHNGLGVVGRECDCRPRYLDASWKIACDLLEYFDSYKLGSVTPIAALIEKAMEAAYEDGVKENKL